MEKYCRFQLTRGLILNQNSKNKILLYAFLAAIVAVFFIPVPIWAKAAISLTLVLVFVYLRRSFMFFVMGAKKMEKKDQRCWDLFKKSIKANLPATQAIYVATAFIKQGDPDYGIQVCRDIIARKPGSEDAKSATVTLSMGLWVKNEIDEAISLLSDLKNNGYSNKTLDINLSTYLLEKGDTAEALRIIKESEDAGTISHGMLDNKLWAFILKGRFDDALPIVSELMEERKPKFPEAYLHSAQVMIHQGRVDKAIEYLDDAIGQRFSLNGTMGQAYLERLSSGLSDKATRKAYAAAMNHNTALLARGKDFDIDLNEGADYDEVSESQILKEKRVKKQESNAKLNHSISDDLDNDREPNTDLTEDDIDCYSDVEDDSDDISDESLAIDPEDEKALNTDVLEEDEREPNTDVF
jgi:tetratricopeptide (TPR) repeat protein